MAITGTSYRRDNGDGTVTWFGYGGVEHTMPAGSEEDRRRQAHSEETRQRSEDREREASWAAGDAADIAAEEEAARRAGYTADRTNRGTGEYDPEGYRDAGGRGYGEDTMGPGEGGGWGWGGDTGGGGYGGGGDPNSWNDWASGVPGLSWLLGQDADESRNAAERENALRMGLWNDLGNWAPSADDLMVNYRHEGEIGPGEDSRMARDAFREWSEGGLTDADRAMMEDARRNSGRAARADREASLSALEARGMGGSGASLAAMLSAGEGAADRNASMDATMMGAAQQRQIGATNALSEFGAREDSYARGREGRNTEYDHRTAESTRDARQTAYENRERATAGATNQYGGTTGTDDDNDEAAVAGVGALLDELFG